MKIKNIIFDLGGVLLNIDYNLTIQAFKELGIKDFEKLYTQIQQTDLFNQYEMGLISNDEFISTLKSFHEEEVSDKMIIDAWNAMLLDLPKERLDLLSNLRKNYSLVLLSNTNFIHLEFFSSYLKTEYQIDDLSEYFDQLYYSCDLNMRKPNKEIFEYVCKKEKFNKGETLFIDDTIQHVNGALSAGLKSLHLDINKESVVDLIQKEVINS